MYKKNKKTINTNKKYYFKIEIIKKRKICRIIFHSASGSRGFSFFLVCWQRPYRRSEIFSGAYLSRRIKKKKQTEKGVERREDFFFLSNRKEKREKKRERRKNISRSINNFLCDIVKRLTFVQRQAANNKHKVKNVFKYAY